MNRVSVSSRIGYFGKIPARSDFVKVADEQPVLGMLDDWVAQVMTRLPADARWKLNYDAMAPASFAFVGPGRRHAVAGHVAASHDRSGRRFPFLMMRTVDVQDPLVLAARCPLVFAPLWTFCEAMAPRVLTSEDPRPHLQAIPDAPVALGEHEAALTNFLAASTVGELSSWLGLAANRMILGLGLLLQPVMPGRRHVLAGTDRALHPAHRLRPGAVPDSRARAARTGGRIRRRRGRHAAWADRSAGRQRPAGASGRRRLDRRTARARHRCPGTGQLSRAADAASAHGARAFPADLYRSRIVKTAIFPAVALVSVLASALGAAAPSRADAGAPIVVSGTVGDDAAKAALLARLRAVYGPERVVDQLAVGRVATPSNWNEIVGRLIGPDLKLVSRGQLQVDGSAVSLRGDVASEAQREQVAGTVAAVLEPGYTVNNGLRVAASEQGMLDAALANRIIEFESGQATLTDSGKAILDQMSVALLRLKDKKVEVIGHTDNAGSRAGNLSLSQARAEAVKAYVAGKGVNPDMVAVSGEGPDRPVADNRTQEGRARNRRIEFKVVQ
jgi:OOP family OmpA-OmpF porin